MVPNSQPRLGEALPLFVVSAMTYFFQEGIVYILLLENFVLQLVMVVWMGKNRSGVEKKVGIHFDYLNNVCVINLLVQSYGSVLVKSVFLKERTLFLVWCPGGRIWR